MLIFVLVGYQKADNDQENITGGVPPLAELFVGLDAYLDAHHAGISSGQNAEFSANGMITTDDVWSLDFIELSDLDISLV